jgi:hypothetical protein
MVLTPKQVMMAQEALRRCRRYANHSVLYREGTRLREDAEDALEDLESEGVDLGRWGDPSLTYSQAAQAIERLLEESRDAR